MISAIIDIIFWSIVLVICFLIIKKSKIINKRRWYVILFVVAFILYSLSGFVPVENAFVTFSSPESAFHYKNSGDVMLVVEGKESAYVVGDKFHVVFPKSGTGWKLGSIGDVEITISGISRNNVIFSVEQYKDSEDYYIKVRDLYGRVVNVADNLNSEFYHVEKTSDAGDEISNLYYTYVNI